MSKKPKEEEKAMEINQQTPEERDDTTVINPPNYETMTPEAESVGIASDGIAIDPCDLWAV